MSRSRHPAQLADINNRPYKEIAVFKPVFLLDAKLEKEELDNIFFGVTCSYTRGAM